MNRKKDDILLKSAFEEFFSDLLHFFYPGVENIIDFDKGFEFLDKELLELFPEVERKGGTRYVDMLVKCYLKDGSEEWILIHIEIQGGSTVNFAQRMFEYWYRIYDRYKVDIAALAVFTGDINQKTPNIFRKSFLKTIHEYTYPVYHILDHSEEELLSMDNPFSMVVLAAQKALLRGKLPEVALDKERLNIAKALINKGIYSHEQIIRFLAFLKNFIYIENSEINSKFDQEVENILGRSEPMGIIETVKMLEREEGREEGSLKKSYKVVHNLLLAEKFSIKEIAQFADVTEDFVLQVKKEKGL